MKRNFTIYLTAIFLLIGTAVFFSSCSDESPISPTSTSPDISPPIYDGVSPETNTYSPDVAIAWYNLEFRLIRQTSPSLGMTPPVSARALGYTGIALYEAVVPGMPLYRSLKNQLNGLIFMSQITQGAEYHWPTSANSALANIVRKFFSNATPANNATIDSLEAAYDALYRPQIDSATFARSKDWGKQIAYSIYRWSATDRGRDGQLRNTDPNYVPPIGPGLWVPTPPAFGAALQPYWGNNRPFITSNVTTNQPPAPIPFSTNTNSQFYAEELEVYTTGINLTPEQIDIARFWADGGGTYTPPGHWIAITQIVLNSLNSKLDVAALAFAKVGISQTDAFISCWKTKYIYNILRPITYIRTYIDSNWSPLIGTPPFPDYTSGHSTQSGAAAQVLTDMFGPNFAFTDTSHPELPIPPRSFNSFLDAANEAAISRMYGGIHYRSANDRGLQCGIAIGKNVSALQFLR